MPGPSLTVADGAVHVQAWPCQGCGGECNSALGWVSQKGCELCCWSWCIATSDLSCLHLCFLAHGMGSGAAPCSTEDAQLPGENVARPGATAQDPASNWSPLEQHEDEGLQEVMLSPSGHGCGFVLVWLCQPQDRSMEQWRAGAPWMQPWQHCTDPSA